MGEVVTMAQWALVLSDPRTRTVLIGTAKNCGLRVHDDPFVSIRHARVVQDPDGQGWVEDLGATNDGVVVVRGDERIQVRAPERIYPGDTILVGRTAIPWTTRELPC